MTRVLEEVLSLLQIDTKVGGAMLPRIFLKRIVALVDLVAILVSKIAILAKRFWWL